MQNFIQKNASITSKKKKMSKFIEAVLELHSGSNSELFTKIL